MEDKETVKIEQREKELEEKAESLQRKEQALQEIKQIEALLRHLQNVQDACVRLGKKLIELEEFDFGKILIANSRMHDNSKFYGVEWEYLNYGSAEEKKDFFVSALQQHQQTNPHHPEHWGGISNMPRIYVAEMVCDWYARSVEMGTDLRKFFTEVALEKYGMSKHSKKYKEVKQFIDLLLEDPFKEIKS